jgi:lipopolysaccharide transport system ATP-binding protein
LLVDEVLAVGDAEFQRRCLGRMQAFGASGRTVLFVSHNMQAIARLCQRTLLLDEGRVVRDGPSPDVVAHYLQTGHGTGSYREWRDLETSPGDDIARLRWVRVVQGGELAETVDVRKPVGIEVAFRVLRPQPLFPKIKLFNGEGDTLFNALDNDARWHEPAEPGDYVSTAWIPGNLLNEGFVTVDVGVVSLGQKLMPHTGFYNAVSFHVYDPGEGDSARGLFGGQLRGAIRPLIGWTTEER